MKKTMFLMFGLFTLIACSDEVVLETTDVTKDEGITPPTLDTTIPYDSPFNDYYAVEIIPYVVDNQFTDDIEIVGHFGFAYYDGVDDGDHFNFDLINNIVPTLYSNNSTEYLNTIYSTEVMFPGSTLTTIVDNRCPVHPIGSLPSFLVDSTFGNGNGVGMEPELIYQTGKMYFLDINIPSIGYTTRIKVKFGNDAMDFGTLSTISPDWDIVGNINGINGDLVYNIYTNEMCLANDSSSSGLRSEDSFVDGLGNVWYIRAYTDATSVIIEVTP